ncbi:uncharacterized protein LOC127415998 [Myxocyprinus asiaticus]|uniref:uncharacterized protein LOC127415998 n=1 Tax=Myxocyprinus asiaticus TaxID=70543 RepID=UPI002221B67D|nr:uncharacterized protein LOC127415998 [Myxocyprinus asiaticus]
MMYIWLVFFFYSIIKDCQSVSLLHGRDLSTEFLCNTSMSMHMPASVCGCLGNPSSLSVVPVNWRHAIAGCDLTGFSKGNLSCVSGQTMGIKEARTTGRCSFSILLTQSIRMTATAFICDMEDSVGARKISEDSHKLKIQVPANTRLKVLVAVLMLLVVGLSGCIIWINVSRQTCAQELNLLPELPQDCPHRFSTTASFIGIKANFTAPRNGTYLIHGTIFKKERKAKGICQEILLLVAKEKVITTESFCEDKVQFVAKAELEKDAGLSLKLNSSSPVQYARDELRPSIGVHGFITVGGSDDGDDAVSVTTSDMGEWSMEDVAAPSPWEGEERAHATDKELLRFLTREPG